jgi:PAS domain S-box-containing protein
MARLALRPFQAADAFRLSDPIVIPYGFPGCNMPAMAPGHESESKQILEAQLRTTLEVIPAYTWYALPSGALTFVNKRHADYLGLPQDHPLRFGNDTGAEWDSHTALLHPEDREEARRVWSACLSTGTAGEFTFRVPGAEGKYRWFLTRAEPFRASDGTLLYWIGVNLDIDDRKRAQDALRKSEKELRDVIDTIPAIVWSTLPDGSNTYVNKRYVEYTGLSTEQVAGSGWKALIHPDDLERHAAKWIEAVATGKPHESEVRSRRSDGQYRWHLDRGVPLRDEDGNIVKWYGVTTDIEDRRRAEEALRLVSRDLQESKSKLEEAQRITHVGYWEWDLITNGVTWSDETYRIYGLRPQEYPMDLATVREKIHPEDWEVVSRALEEALRGGAQYTVESRVFRPTGEVRIVHSQGEVKRDTSGRPILMFGTVQDITDRKHAEEALKRSEAYLAEAQRISHTGSFGWRPDSGEIVWSDETYRIFEYDHAIKPTIDLLVQRVHPDDQPEFLKVIESASAGATQFEHTYRWLLPDGSVKHVHALAHALRDASGNREFVGAATDVTSIKRAEEELRTSEAYLAEAQRLSQTGSWAWNPATQDIKHWSEECCRIFGFEPDAPPPPYKVFLQRIYPDDQIAFSRQREKAIRERTDFETDYRILHPKRGIRNIHSVARAVLSLSGDLVEFVGTVIDVTERKRAEEERRRSEIELRQMLDLAPQQIHVLGADGNTLYANRAVLEYFGATIDQWHDQEFRFGLAHPDDLEHYRREKDRRLLEGVAHEFEMRFRRHDGKFRWFLVRRNPVKDEQGQLTRWYVSATDIEDRKQAEDRLLSENVALREEIDKASMFEEIVGTSPALQTVLSDISKVAPSDSTVLITGETGTGKELVARAIHRRSNRASRSFVSVNCAAIPRDLIASELFGHEKGAFTGATQQRLGRFELANGGTLFLDEAGELPAETQIALLRVLQEHEFERVGGTRPIRADVRVIAATNRDLEAAISAGSFRSDLYYRLNVFPIEIPALRERKQDIPLLVEYFIDRYARKAGKKITTVDKKTLQLLESYPWPGNIRELQNVIERSIIVCETETFSVDESWLSKSSLPSKPRSIRSEAFKVEAEPRSEREIIEAALAQSRGRVSGPFGAAAKLGIPPSTLETRIKTLKINKSQFKFR